MKDNKVVVDLLNEKEKIAYNEAVKSRCSIVAVKEFPSDKISDKLPCRFEYYSEKLYCRWEGCQEMTNRAFVVSLDFFRKIGKEQKPDLYMQIPYCDKHMEQYQIESMLSLAKARREQESSKR